MKIVWNNHALESLDKNIDHLKNKWSTKDVENFLNIVDEKISLLKDNPEIGIICEFKPLFYEIEEKQIYLHLFWLNYRNPNDLQMFLS